MKKLIIAYLFTITNIFAAPPTYFNGELQTNTYIQNIKAPNYQTTPLGGIDRRLETGNLNELQNPSFEHVTVATGWTVSNATSSSSTTRIEGSKSLSLALTGALSLSQSSTINAAQKSGVQMVASIWVNSSDVSDLQLCSLKNGSEDKCTVTGGYVQGSGWRQLTVSFLGDATSNGLKLKSTDTTGTVLVDQAYVGIGSPVVDFTPDMVYSAKVSATGVVSDENADWISGDCTNANPSACTFSAGVFTVAPNCVATANNSGRILAFSSITSSSASIEQINDSGAGTKYAFVLNCQKQGADYKTSKAYVASSSDYGRTAYTPTYTGFGVVSASSCYHSRDGGFLNVDCRFTVGSSTATEARISLPSGLTVSSEISTGIIVGIMGRQTSVNNALSVIAEPSVSYLTFGGGAQVASMLAKQNGNAISSSGDTFSFSARIPISGWTDSSVIVGSFQGYNETPGTSRVETFSVSYGTTNATTVCSASPCSYLDQIGNAVTSITRSTAGNYTLNTSKTYSKLKCSATTANASSVAPIGASVTSCTNCSSFNFLTGNPASAYVDTYGTLVCQGIPQ